MGSWLNHASKIRSAEEMKTESVDGAPRMNPAVSPTRSDMLDPDCRSRRSSDGERPCVVAFRRSGCRDSGFISSVSSATDSILSPDGLQFLSDNEEDEEAISLEAQESHSSVRFWCGEDTNERRERENGAITLESDDVTNAAEGGVERSSCSGSLPGIGARLNHGRRFSVDGYFCARFRDPEVQSNLNVPETTDSLDDLDKVDGSDGEDDSGSLTYESDMSSNTSSEEYEPVPLRANEPLPAGNVALSDSDDDSVFDAEPVGLPARHRAYSFSSLPDVVRPCIRRERLRTCPAQLFLEVGQELRRVADDFQRSTPSLAQDRGRSGSLPVNDLQRPPPQQPPQPQHHRWFMQLLGTLLNRDHGVNQDRPQRRGNTIWYIN